MASSLPEKLDWSAPTVMKDHIVCSTEVPAGNKASFRETSLSGHESHVPR